MPNHVNIENDEVTIPYYAVHKDELIAGFFGPFRWMSNFYILKEGVGFEELVYPSVEAAFQAAKWPQNQRTQFLDITAGQAKRLGKMAPNFNKKKWDKNKVELMRALVFQKFKNNINLRKMLMETDGYKLEERNNWGDLFWGTNEQGEGENNLGKILMSVRDKFIAVEKNNEF
jgi:ribA/ribD-fused uncharacterized protein